MANKDSRSSGKDTSQTRVNPGDDAKSDTPGTGENVCPECRGSGRAGAQPCKNCGGSGKIIQGVGGG